MADKYLGESIKKLGFGLMRLPMKDQEIDMEQTKKMIAKISMCENLVLVCNYGDRAQAKWIARTYHRRVYCFPLDADPFRMTGEKRRFFQKLLRQEGW